MLNMMYEYRPSRNIKHVDEYRPSIQLRSIPKVKMKLQCSDKDQVLKSPLLGQLFMESIEL